MQQFNKVMNLNQLLLMLLAFENLTSLAQVTTCVERRVGESAGENGEDSTLIYIVCKRLRLPGQVRRTCVSYLYMQFIFE